MTAITWADTGRSIHLFTGDRILFSDYMNEFDGINEQLNAMWEGWA